MIVFKTIPIAYSLLAGAKFGNVQYFSQSQVWSRAELGWQLLRGSGRAKNQKFQLLLAAIVFRTCPIPLLMLGTLPYVYYYNQCSLLDAKS